MKPRTPPGPVGSCINRRRCAVAEDGMSRLQGMPVICPLSEGVAVSDLWMLTEVGGFIDWIKGWSFRASRVPKTFLALTPSSRHIAPHRTAPLCSAPLCFEGDDKTFGLWTQVTRLGKQADSTEGLGGARLGWPRRVSPGTLQCRHQGQTVHGRRGRSMQRKRWVSTGDAPGLVQCRA